VGAAVERERDRRRLVADDDAAGLVDELGEHVGGGTRARIGERELRLADDLGGAAAHGHVERVDGAAGRERAPGGGVGGRDDQRAVARRDDRGALRGWVGAGRAPLRVVGQPLEGGAGVDGRVLADVALQPGDDRLLDVPRRAGAGQARAVAAAEPHHLRRDVVGPEDLVVGDRLFEGEERVRAALDEEGGDRDLPDEVAGAA
jgi:hypothetical protein